MAKKEMIGKTFNYLTVLEEIKERDKYNKIYYKCICKCGKEVINTGIAIRSGAVNSCGCLSNERKRSKDIIGSKFGRLTPYEAVKKNNRWYYKCRCECGNEAVIRGDSLKDGKTTSCGCERNIAVSKRHKKNIIGNVFGKLTAIEEVGKSKSGNIRYKCLCECGNETIVNGNHLRRGDIQSCGCTLSRANLMTRNILESLKVNFEQEKKFDDCKYKDVLSFDFHLIDLNILIELDGEQHFKERTFGSSEQDAKIKFAETVIRDAIKNSYCEDNNIKLIRIPFWEFGNLNEIISNIATVND